MNLETDYAYFRMQLIAESPKAICVKIITTGDQVWVPKSLCEIKGNTLVVEEWFATKENMYG